jgi:hypothetical protein
MMILSPLISYWSFLTIVHNVLDFLFFLYPGALIRVMNGGSLPSLFSFSSLKKLLLAGFST